jgi:ABC-2 type transport system permease protein
MNRTLRAILGAVLILIIVFSGISVCQNLGRRVKLDVTDQHMYTLSPGTKAILGKLTQPIKVKLYYAEKAAMKGPDQIRYFNNYYEFVKAILQEYVAVSKGMVQLEVIDPRPFSVDEEQAMRAGLQQFPMTQDENFFFGLVMQTQFGVEKAIPFFSPDRHNFVEYDISYLIDTAITKQKKKIGVMSSMSVMGQDISPYMAQMMAAQGQRPEPPWGIVEQLKNKYEVKSVPTDVNDINDVDVLLVIQPKNLPERTQFAIDQFVLKGGRTVVCVDPFCWMDRPQRNPMQMTQQDQSSNLDRLLRTWGLQMPQNTFAGDRSLAIETPLGRNQRAEPLIGFLGLKPECFNKESVMVTNLNQVRMLFAGVLNEIDASGKAGGAKAGDPNQPTEAKRPEAPSDLTRTPLVMTTAKGNAFRISSPFELMYPDPAKLMSSFADGTKPVNMGYFITGHFKSSFPQGIDVEVAAKDPNSKDKADDPNKPKMVKKHITGLTEAKEKGAVVVFSDVDFLTDQLACSSHPLFGRLIVGDNIAVLLNAVEELSGSGDLISIRSRGNYKRPFKVVDKIEQEAQEKTANEIAVINAQIEGFNADLQALVSSKDQPDVVGSTIVQKKRDLELKIREAQRQLREIKSKQQEQIDQLGRRLQMGNMVAVPSVVMLVAVVLGIWRSLRRRHYISHASDA